jgi:hypothetical protein
MIDGARQNARDIRYLRKVVYDKKWYVQALKEEGSKEQH